MLKLKLLFCKILDRNVCNYVDSRKASILLNKAHLESWALKGFSVVVTKIIFPGRANSGETSFQQLTQNQEKNIFLLRR